MDYWGQLVLCFLIATAVTLLDLFTSTYPATWRLLVKRVGPHLYAVIYGLLAVVALAAFGDAIKLDVSNGVNISVAKSPWTKAIVVGLFTKSIMQMTLLTVGPTPIGLKTVTLLFEPFFLRSFLLAEFNAVRAYVAPRASRYPLLADVQKMIKDNTPITLPEQGRIAFQAAVDKETTVVGSMERFLRFVGFELFNATFP